MVGEEPIQGLVNPRPSGPLFIRGRRCATKQRYSLSFDQKKPRLSTRLFNVVGEEGFEPPTLWSQTRCATKLRYSPNCFRLIAKEMRALPEYGVANEA